MTKIPKSEQLFGVQLGFRCPKQWKHMKGDAITRHCDTCDKNVYNISMLTRNQALKVIEEKEGKLCVVFYQRPDGTVVTQDCISIVGLQRLRMKFNLFAKIHAGLAALWLTIIPMLGPAMCTIIAGGLGRQTDPSPDNNSVFGEEPKANSLEWPDLKNPEDLLNLRHITKYRAHLDKHESNSYGSNGGMMK